jgi:hypothetical protein
MSLVETHCIPATVAEFIKTGPSLSLEAEPQRVHNGRISVTWDKLSDALWKTDVHPASSSGKHSECHGTKRCDALIVG